MKLSFMALMSYSNKNIYFAEPKIESNEIYGMM